MKRDIKQDIYYLYMCLTMMFQVQTLGITCATYCYFYKYKLAYNYFGLGIFFLKCSCFETQQQIMYDNVSIFN